MKIIFFGSDDFAQVHLKELLATKCEVVACVTQPDRPKGRGMNVVVSPVKQCAQENNVDVLQPEELKGSEFSKALKGYGCDLFVVIAYGKILPQNIIDVPRLGAINVHGSLLPQYRGAAPINWAIINGEKKTGLSIIKINDRMDAGDVLAKQEIAIDPLETSLSLREKMMDVGPGFLKNTLDNIEEQLSNAQVQNKSHVTLAPKLTKELGKIDWKKAAGDIHSLVCGLVPWPGAYTYYKGKSLKIIDTEIVDCSAGADGEILEIRKDGFIVCTGEKGLLIKEVHLESSKKMPASSFIAGAHLKAGEALG